MLKKIPTEYVFLLLVVALLLFGWVAVTSASMEVALNYQLSALHYFKRHLVFMLVGVAMSFFVMQIPLRFWQEKGWVLLPITFVLLIWVLIPGLGYEVNGAQRWIRLGKINLQISELAKMAYLMYLAGYLVRHPVAIQHSWAGLLKPLMILLGLLVLILGQPDFGTVLVLSVSVIGVIFLSGARLNQLLIIGCILLAIATLLVVFEPYRLQRILAFRDPWADPYNSSYQLTQSLIAFGRGNWFGLGLGGSVQKLLFLPEAHTDFIFAVICEELGVLGGLVVGMAFMMLVMVIFKIGMTAERLKHAFGAYLCYGVALMIGLQFLINIGVNLGLLPTKGLTLPLISYGGSSLVLTLIGLGLVHRTQIENRRELGWPRSFGA